jgi:hypothetical protein
MRKTRSLIAWSRAFAAAVDRRCISISGDRWPDDIRLSDLEPRFARHSQRGAAWGQPFTIENMLDTLEATLTCPVSDQTLAKLREAK